MSSKKISWKKLVFTTIWLLAGAGTVVLLVAAAKQHASEVCKEVVVTVKSADGVEYVSKKNILAAISGNRPDLLIGAPVRTFDLKQLEDRLEKNLWIRNAELFFDNNNVLHADITERRPVARVFTVSGETFYVDELGEQLPVSTDQVARVPVFTSFPTVTYPLKDKDSVLLLHIKELGTYLLKHDFWMAQVEQVEINNYEMELIPKLGKHIIQFGTAEQAAQKFNRLLLFYKNIMRKTGWNFYSTLDVRYNKQLVAVRRDSASLFKSFVLTTDTTYKNTIETGTVFTTDSTAVNLPAIKKDSTVFLTPGTKPATQNPASVPLKSAITTPKQNSNALKNQTPSQPVPAKTAKPKSTDEENVLNEVKSQAVKKTVPVKKEPKAVMPKKENN
jgi:cell division protein FtsQ